MSDQRFGVWAYCGWLVDVGGFGVRVGRGVTPPGTGLGDGDGDSDGDSGGDGLGDGDGVIQKTARSAWTVPTAPAAAPPRMGVRVGRAVTPFDTGVGEGVQMVVVSPVPPSDDVACRFCAPMTAIAANSMTSATTAAADNETGDFIDDLHSVARSARAIPCWRAYVQTEGPLCQLSAASTPSRRTAKYTQPFVARSQTAC